MKNIAVIILVAFCMGIKAQNLPAGKEYVNTDDSVRIFVKQSGQGPLCIFIHGGPGAWSRSFEELKGNNLESGLTMVYYDQRGCGRSESSPDGNYSIDRMVEDIDLIRKYYHADKVYLLSHSFGGILAVNYALRYPDRVRGLILANSTLNIGLSLKNQIDYINLLLTANFTVQDSSESSLMSTFIRAKSALTDIGLSYKVLSDSKNSVEKVDSIDRLNSRNYDFARKAFQMDEYWQDFTKLSRKIGVPVLVITGTKDHSVGENHYLLFEFKNHRVVRINGGHLLYYENNQRFVQSVFDFVGAK